MKSIILKTSAKDSVLKKALKKANEDLDPKERVLFNDKYMFKNFGYKEFVMPSVTKDREKAVFQHIMHQFAHMKIWVECMNVTIVTKYAPEYGVQNKGARYNGTDFELRYRDIKIGNKTFRVVDEDDAKKQRVLNLSIDGADRLGALNGKKKGMSYHKIKWYTDGVMEEKMKQIKDDEGNVVEEKPTGEFALNFDFEPHGHSEQYSNYKHFRRKHYDIIFSRFDESSLVTEPAPRRG